MYNNFIKLTEQYRRDDTRPVFINLNYIVRIAVVDGKTRLWVPDGAIIEVLEPPETIFGKETLPVILTDKDENG